MEGTSGGLLSNFLLRQGQTSSLRVLSSQVFKTSKDGDSTTSLGNLFHCLTFPTYAITTAQENLLSLKQPILQCPKLIAFQALAMTNQQVCRTASPCLDSCLMGMRHLVVPQIVPKSSSSIILCSSRSLEGKQLRQRGQNAVLSVCAQVL